MKKVLLALSLTAGFSAFAQQSVESNSNHIPFQPTADQIQKVEATLAAKAERKKVAGGVFTNSLFGWSEAQYALYGGSASGLFGSFVAPLWKDSTVVMSFTSGDSYVNTHAVGNTFDPTSSFVTDRIAPKDDYTIDSVFVVGLYETPSSIPNPSGDSIIVEVVWGPASDGTTWNSVFLPPNATNPDTNYFLPPNYTGDETSTTTFAGANKIRTGYELTTADLATAQANVFVYGVEINQVIPAGSMVCVSYQFKSAYENQISAGEDYFNSAEGDSAKIPNFSVWGYQPASQSDAFRYFGDPDGLNCTSQLGNTSLYNAFTGGQAFLNDIYSPRSQSAYRALVMYSANSTFSIDENSLASFDIYPNPTSGNVTLEIAQGGTYSIDVLNLVGQVVYSEEVSINGGEKLNRDFSNLNKGVYLINLNGEGVSKTSKLTIK